MIIDFHTHTFPESISLKVVESLGKNGHTRYFTDASVNALVTMMRESGTDYSVNLPVMTRPGQVTQINDSMIRQQEELLSRNIITFGGIHPAYEDYAAEIQRLKASGIKGIKLHPAFQGTHINDISYKRIIGAASEAGLITIVHCGLDVGFMDQNFAPVNEITELIHDVQPQRLVLAHMGGWQAWNEVESDLAGADVYLDTAYSLGPVYAREGDEELMPFKYNLTAEAFTRLSRKHGIQKVLFATDCPWAKQHEYIEFIAKTELDDSEKSMILSGNARSLLGL